MVRYGNRQASLKSPLQTLVLRIALAALCVTSAFPLNAKTVAIVVSQDSASYHKIARVIEQELKVDQRLQVRRLGIAEIGAGGSALADADLLLTIGHEAALLALQQRGARPLLCAFVSESAFETAVLQHFDSIDAGLKAGIWALYFDQPAERVFQLARKIVPEARTAGLALGPVLQTQQQNLEKLARQVKLELRTAVVAANDNPVKTLKPLVQQTDLMIALPDKALWHSQTAKWLLYLAYRRSKPVIAFSARFTEVGAVASLFTKPQDIAEQAAKISRLMLDQPSPGQIYWPDKFHIRTNLSVARSLGLKLLDAKDYQRQIMLAEGSP